MNPPRTFEFGADEHRALEPRAVPHLHAGFEHDRTLADVEHHARLDRGAHDDHVCRVAEYDAALRHAAGRRPAKVGAVLAQEPLECRDQIEATAEQKPFHFDGVTPLLRAFPPLAGWNQPRDRGPAVRQPPYRGAVFELRDSVPGGGEPAGRDDRGPVDRRRRANRRCVAFDESVDVLAQNRGGLSLAGRFPPLPNAPRAGRQLGDRPSAGKGRPFGTRLLRLQQVEGGHASMSRISGGRASSNSFIAAARSVGMTRIRPLA